MAITGPMTNAGLISWATGTSSSSQKESVVGFSPNSAERVLLWQLASILQLSLFRLVNDATTWTFILLIS